jgi:hypothetical protein
MAIDILDVCIRPMMGWAIRDHIRAESVVEALERRS